MDQKKESLRIEIQGISQSFGEKKVLDDIRLDIGSREIFGLLGPSGAGKTTLLKILTGQLVQTEGTAKILGTDTKKLTDKEYSKIGMMLDTSGLYER